MEPISTAIEWTVEPVPPELLGRIRKGLFAFNHAPERDIPDARLETVLSYATHAIDQGHDHIQLVHLRDASYTCLDGFPLQFTPVSQCTWDPTGPVFTLERRMYTGRQPDEPSVRWTPAEGLMPWTGEPPATGLAIPAAVADSRWARILPTGIPGVCWATESPWSRSSVLDLISWPGRERLAAIDLAPWAPDPEQLGMRSHDAPWPTMAFPLLEMRAVLMYWGRHMPRVRDQPKRCFLVRVSGGVALETNAE